ncbi:MAG: DinB family protein [Planctomycetota bacterium]|jgi:uncharacterized damage-inducible protein DinB
MKMMTDALVAELEQEAQTTRRMLERVPFDKLEWKPHPKSMTLGELALHVATTPGNFAKLLSGDSIDVEGVDYQAPVPASGAELLSALDASTAAAKEFLGQLDDQSATTVWRAVRGDKELLSAPRIALVRSMMFNHWYHHRGELVVYLRELEVPIPAIYGPSADEDPFEA